MKKNFRVFSSSPKFQCVEQLLSIFICNYMDIFICSASFQSWLWTKRFHKRESVKNLGSWEWYMFCKCVASCHSGVFWCVRPTRWISPLCWKVEMECREWQEVDGIEMEWKEKDVSSRDAESASLKLLQLKIWPRKYPRAMIDIETICWTCCCRNCLLNYLPNLHLYDQWLELHLYFNILRIWLKTWT